MATPQTLSEALEQFWSHWNLCDIKGPAHPSDYQRRISALQQMDLLRFVKKCPSNIAAIRQDFESNLRHKRLWRKPCWACGKRSHVRHHIVELQNGGSNDPDNIIPLCNTCHHIIHPWMKGPPVPRQPKPNRRHPAHRQTRAEQRAMLRRKERERNRANNRLWQQAVAERRAREE